MVDGFKQGQWDVIDTLIDDFLVVIDDIGAEHDPSKIGMEKLCQVLSRRENKFTVITTNITIDQWPEKFDERVFSRLNRNTTLIDLSEVPDYNA